MGPASGCIRTLFPITTVFGTKIRRVLSRKGGYPGFVLSTASDTFGDFHDPSVSYTTDSINGSLFGLIDIAQEKNIQLIRHPVAAGNPDNIPAGTIWNKPDPNNAQFYTDQGSGGIAMNDPNTGGAFTRYNFNLNNPLAGDAVKENATGLLMRNMQWMIQVIGVDGFRIDAARHMPTWVFNYFDNAVFRTSLRTNLDGTIQADLHVFGGCRRQFRQRATVHSPRLAQQVRHQHERHDRQRQSRCAGFPAVLETDGKPHQQRCREQLA